MSKSNPNLWTERVGNIDIQHTSTGGLVLADMVTGYTRIYFNCPFLKALAKFRAELNRREATYFE